MKVKTFAPRGGWTVHNTELSTWFERDRAHVALCVSEELDSPLAGHVIIDLWDDEVTSLVEDGFLNPRDWHGSVLEYANTNKIGVAVLA